MAWSSFSVMFILLVLLAAHQLLLGKAQHPQVLAAADSELDSLLESCCSEFSSVCRKNGECVACLLGCCCWLEGSGWVRRMSGIAGQ